MGGEERGPGWGEASIARGQKDVLGWGLLSGGKPVAPAAGEGPRHAPRGPGAPRGHAAVSLQEL